MFKELPKKNCFPHYIKEWLYLERFCSAEECGRNLSVKKILQQKGMDQQNWSEVFQQFCLVHWFVFFR